MLGSVLVALSGGVDSAITAQKLIEQGYDVTGVHFIFYDEPTADVRSIANKIGIPFIEYDAREIFRREVIGYFTEFHLAGKTPSPCAYCNPHVKWKLLLKLADEHTIQFIATGHYIIIEKENGLFRMYKGKDISKEQSYYLWGLNQEILSRALTPMGKLSKTLVKRQAGNSGFKELYGRKESTGLCFSRNRNCTELLREFIPDLKEKINRGAVINRNGEEIGSHNGYVYYTIGQKKDLELTTDEKLCVTRVDADQNILEADTWESLYLNEFSVKDFLFADKSELLGNENIQVKVRGFGLNPEGNCRVIGDGNSDILRVNLNNPVWAPAPGQPAVFYSGDKLLGGGIIC